MCALLRTLLDSGIGAQPSLGNEFEATTKAGLLHRSQSSPIMGYKQEVD